MARATLARSKRPATTTSGSPPRPGAPALLPGDVDLIDVTLGVEAGPRLQLFEGARPVGLAGGGELGVQGAGHEPLHVETHHVPGPGGQGEGLGRKRAHRRAGGIEVKGTHGGQGPGDDDQGRAQHDQTASRHWQTSPIDRVRTRAWKRSSPAAARNTTIIAPTASRHKAVGRTWPKISAIPSSGGRWWMSERR